MGQATLPETGTDARSIATCLEAVAEQLHRARDVAEFFAAVDAHRRVWLGVRQACPTVRSKIPERLLEFSLAVSARQPRRLSDQEVETLIQIDRFVSAAIASDPSA